ncbi:hypothetical protein FOFC_12921 [Fusarium oxysporum]|nr:hypothetical protein FOFC_12921 [Fusarium oxysporum]
MFLHCSQRLHPCSSARRITRCDSGSSVHVPSCASLRQLRHVLVSQRVQRAIPASMERRGINSEHALSLQYVRLVVSYSSRLLSHSVNNSSGMNVFVVSTGIACPQHLGGKRDSSLIAVRMLLIRHGWHIAWEQGASKIMSMGNSSLQ